MTAKRDLWSDPVGYNPLQDGPPYLQVPEGTRVASTGAQGRRTAAVVPPVERMRIAKAVTANSASLRPLLQQALHESFGDMPYAELGTLVGTLQAAALLYKTHHWRAKGRFFYEDHLLFERVYNDINGLIDGVAERAVGLGGTILVEPSRLLAIQWAFIGQVTQNLQPGSPGPETASYFVEVDANEFIPLSLTTVMICLAMVREMWTSLKDKGQNTPGVEDLLQSTASTLESIAYLLKQAMPAPGAV